jgi:hypothetical protein
VYKTLQKLNKRDNRSDHVKRLTLKNKLFSPRTESNHVRIERERAFYSDLQILLYEHRLSALFTELSYDLIHQEVSSLTYRMYYNRILLFLGRRWGTLEISRDVFYNLRVYQRAKLFKKSFYSNRVLKNAKFGINEKTKSQLYFGFVSIWSAIKI